MASRVKRVRLVTVLVCQARSRCLGACYGIDILALSLKETSDSYKKQNYEAWRHRNDPPKSYQTGHFGSSRPVGADKRVSAE